MSKRSAGILMYRLRNGDLEVFLVHPGGPFWAKKDEGAWTVPKGEYDGDEDPLAAAIREFGEETGFPTSGDFLELGQIRQASGKFVTAWAMQGDCDPQQLVSNFCEVEWPPRSGRKLQIPEVDRGAWFGMEEARKRMFSSQTPFLDRLAEALRSSRQQKTPRSSS